MRAEIFLTSLSCIITGIVGIVLFRQIKSQKQIIEQYKGLVEATSPDKIVTLHKREIEQITNIMSTDIKQLRTQVLELGTYVNFILDSNVKTAKTIGHPEAFNRLSVIATNMPNSGGILNKISEYYQSLAPTA